MGDSIEVVPDIPAGDKDAVQFDRTRAPNARAISHMTSLRVASTPAHLYVSGRSSPGPWYRLTRGKWGLYRMPRSAISAITLIEARQPFWLPFYLVLIMNSAFRRQWSDKTAAWIAVVLLLLGFASIFFSKRLSLTIQTPDGPFYSTSVDAMGPKAMREAKSWMTQLRAELKAGNWPVTPA